MGKIKLNKEGLQGFFVRHVEKIVLGVVIMLLVVFVYSGYSLEGLPPDQAPDKLVERANQAKSNIVNPENWNGIQTELVVPTGHKQRAARSQELILATNYSLEKPWEPQNQQQGQKRGDPTLFAPEKVEVVAMTGPVAFRMEKGEQDPLADAKNTTVEVKEKPKPKSSRKKAGGMADMMMGGMGSMGMDMEDAMGEGGGMGMDAGMMMSGSMPGMTGSMPGMAGDLTGGAAGGVVANPQDRKGFQAGPGAIAKSRTYVFVKALVPWKQQWNEFDQKFSSALGYNPARDVPRYIWFSAQRADVTDDPDKELVEEDWVVVAHTNASMKQLQTAGYYSLPPEIADPRYVHPSLTIPLPPFMNRDLEALALHSDVPKANARMQPQPTTEDAKKKGDGKKAKPGLPGSDDPILPGAAGAANGMMGMQGMPGGYPGGDGGMGMGMSGEDMGGVSDMGMGGMGMGSMPGMMPSMDSSMGMGSMPGAMSGMDGSMGGMGSMPGMMSGMDGGMGGMTGMATAAPGPQAPYLLIRFYDYNAEVGRKYRYRVQVLLEDPNHPFDARMEPMERYLDETVKKRLLETTASEKENKRKWYLRTDFSKPSDVVSVEIQDQTIAGQIAPGRFTVLRGVGSDVPYQVDEPTGKVMSVVWDEERAVDVPGVLNAMRGTFLNFQSKADVIHPVTLVFKTLEGYEFQTNRLVADIRGGEPLPATDKSELVGLGEYAVFDEDGQLRVYNELDDWREFRKLVPPEAAPAAEGMMMPGMDGDVEGDMEDGMMMPGMPGETGGRRRGRRGGGGGVGADSG